MRIVNFNQPLEKVMAEMRLQRKEEDRFSYYQIVMAAVIGVGLIVLAFHFT